MTKVWWSELDVELHEIAMDLLGPDAELEGPWSKGWQFSLSGPIYAGTNEIQRNVTAERVLGLPGAAMRFAWTDDQLAFRDAVRDARCAQGRPSWTRPRRAWACCRCSCPRPTAGSGSTSCVLVPVLEETGRVALRRPARRDGDGRRAARRRPGGW